MSSRLLWCTLTFGGSTRNRSFRMRNSIFPLIIYMVALSRKKSVASPPKSLNTPRKFIKKLKPNVRAFKADAQSLTLLATPARTHLSIIMLHLPFDPSPVMFTSFCFVTTLPFSYYQLSPSRTTNSPLMLTSGTHSSAG